MHIEPVTRLLERVSSGDTAAREELFTLVYAELRRRAERLVPSGEPNTLQPTAVVHEAWMRLSAGSGDWNSRAHFLGVAARAMRSVLVDHARAKGSEKRGGAARRVGLDAATRVYEERAIDLVALDEALARLSDVDIALTQIVELRFFSGLSIAETARVMGVSTPTVERGWTTARSWLRVQLDADGLFDHGT